MKGYGALVGRSLVVIAFAATPAFAQDHLWSRRFGGPVNDGANSVAVDATGNVAVTGRFDDTIDFGGGNLYSAGGTDIFLASLDPGGDYRWGMRFGDTVSDHGNAVAMDASGNVFVTGDFSGTVNFGGGDLVSAGGQDVFLAKYSANGVPQWSKKLGSTGNDVGYGVAVDGSGSVVVTGYFWGTADFGGGNRTSAGFQDAFLARYDTDGNHQWSQRFGGTSGDSGRSVTVAPSGSISIAGSFIGSADFGGGFLIGSGFDDVFLATYDVNGVHQWSKRLGGGSSDFAYSVATDGAGNVFASGFFQGTADFGTGDFVSAGYYDVFLSKFDISGTCQWSRHFAGTGDDQALAVAVDASGSALLAGYFEDTVDFGGGNLVSLGNKDVFVAKYDAGGSHQWSRRFGAGTWDAGHGVALDPWGGIHLAGRFGQGVDFGGGGLLSVGTSDAFLLKMVNTLTSAGETPGLGGLSVSSYPNPFNPGTTVSYTVPSRARVTVAIYDARGARVATLVDNEERAAGAHRVEWDAHAASGAAVSSGVYFARIEHPSGTRSTKLMLLK